MQAEEKVVYVHVMVIERHVSNRRSRVNYPSGSKISGLAKV